MKRIPTIATLATIVAAATLASASPSHANSSDSPSALPPLPPTSSFGTGAVNPYFPIVPGTTTVFAGSIDGVAARETFSVTRGTEVVDGVPANVIRDRLYLARADGDGRYLAEDTTDWYATDATGTVWYLGEDTAEYDENGTLLSTDGSWKAGVDGARAGIFMPAVPTVGAVYQQESATDAQDFFRITAIEGDTVVTREYTPLEPGLITKKVYETDVGQVLEDTVKGASIEDLILRLVSVRHS
jgi:hypothetical protein